MSSLASTASRPPAPFALAWAALFAAVLIGAAVLLPAEALSSSDPLPPCPADAPGDLPPVSPGPAVAEHVVLISVDGLRPDAVDALGPAGAPALYRFRTEGATTDNARTDPSFTNTLPNHTAQLTGRGVQGPCGHNWTENDDPARGQTLHSGKGAYVASAFDVAHDAGLRTVLFASKPKFSLFSVSFGPDFGAPDTTGVDDGRGKVDRFVYEADTDVLVERFVAELVENRPGFSFLHLRDPDARGHQSGWDLAPGSPYLGAVRQSDRLVGLVLDAVQSDPRLRETTAVILTSDHGGSDRGHGDASISAHYAIPFYVWGAGVEAGTDLYSLNDLIRLDPEGR